MRWRGVSPVELAVLNYNDSIAFYDALFGWLGYKSFSSLNMEYQSMYYMTRFANPHSYIGIQPARTGGRLTHSDHAVGLNHIALWARNRAEVDRFHREFLIGRGVHVTDESKEYPQYWPGYYAVFFDDPIRGMHGS
jgi:catechol 2,3-dioxygenase-like lactoylglutathione lyase family enzyme